MNALRKFKDRLLTRLWYLRYKDSMNARGIRRILALTPEEKKRRGIERTVRLIINHKGIVWNSTLEQTPGGNCQWGKTLFVGSGPADHYVVITALPKPPPDGPGLDIELPGPERVWGMLMEPEEYVRKFGYDKPEEHAKMSRIYTNCDYLIDKGAPYRGGQSYIFWHLIRSWDWLERATVPRKSMTLGVINSGLQNIEGHRQRHEFLEKLDASGIDFGMWGRGSTLERFRAYRGFAPSKWKVHAKCRYTLVMENAIADWWWTEKIADSLLAWSVPLYYGCPKIYDYFPEESLIPIDIHDPDCVRQIETILATDKWEKRLPALNEARRRLLHEHNLYAFLDGELNAASL